MNKLFYMKNKILINKTHNNYENDYYYNKNNNIINDKVNYAIKKKKLFI